MANGTFNCSGVSHPLLNGDPTALVFLTSLSYGGKKVSAEYDFAFHGWLICSYDSAFAVGDKVAVLVIKQ